jgi:hypothetical protein
VSKNSLALFDDTIQDTAAQLRALGDMTVFAEKPMVIGSGLDVPPTGPQNNDKGNHQIVRALDR